MDEGKKGKGRLGEENGGERKRQREEGNSEKARNKEYIDRHTCEGIQYVKVRSRLRHHA